MTITFSKISNIFLDFLANPDREFYYSREFHQLVYLCIKTNKALWDLEDSARLSELGDKHVAETKRKIDVTNQSRNNLMRGIDIILYKELCITPSSADKYYSESPGMIIDRLSIIFIKLSIIKKLILLIKECDLNSEYKAKGNVLANQIKSIGQFLDTYVERLGNKDIFFEVQQPVKIYNDVRVREYIKSLK